MGAVSIIPFFLSDNEVKRERAYDGLLLDAGGTLLQLAKPVEQIYINIGTKYGVRFSPFGFLEFVACFGG